MRQVRRGQPGPGPVRAAVRRGPPAADVRRRAGVRRPVRLRRLQHGPGLRLAERRRSAGPRRAAGGRGPRPAPNWRPPDQVDRDHGGHRCWSWSPSARTSGPTPSSTATSISRRSSTGPTAGEGTNYLIVGSDSREGMSAEEKKKLHTGSAEGKRTDSMMILHIGDNGSTLISLPRDSNVRSRRSRAPSPARRTRARAAQVKLNAAYAEDGPELLVRTVEFNTGLRIDHYVEIGFARLREHRRLGRRRGDRHPQGRHEGHQVGRRLRGGQADPERRAGPGLRPYPVRVRGQRPGPYEEPAEVPLGPGQPGRRRRARSSTPSSSTRPWAPASTPSSSTRT